MKTIIAIIVGVIAALSLAKINDDDRIKDPYASILMLFIIVATIFIFKMVV